MQIDQVSAGGAEGAGGQAAGTATGMYYDNARFYDPVTGRFLNQDPMGYAAGDPNVYRFVGNDPTSATDPSGMEPNLGGGDVNANGGSSGSSDLMNYVGRTWSATAPDAANTNVSGSQRFPFAPGAAYAGVDLNAAQSSFPGNNYTPTATELSAIALAEQVTQYEAAATKANQAISDYLANNPIPPQFSNTGNFDRPLPDDFVPENLRDAAQYASDTADLANQVYSNLYGSQQWTTPYAQGDVMFGAPDEPSTPAGAIDLVRQANGKWPTAQSVSIVGTAVQVYAVTTGAQAALSLGGTAWSVGTGLVWGSDVTSTAAAAADSGAGSYNTGYEWYQSLSQKYGDVEWVSGSGRTLNWPSELPVPPNDEGLFLTPSMRTQSAFTSSLEDVAGARPIGPNGPAIAHHVQFLGMNGSNIGAENGMWIDPVLHTSGHADIMSQIGGLYQLPDTPYGTQFIPK